ncbi:MAG: hypothetical protein KGV56_00450 [Gammaproteobacteria bacterium]|nr:hypothetical protein [Gammaproteobacteria bacterium]
MKILIGIDPGVKTGLAYLFDGELNRVFTSDIIKVMSDVENVVYHAENKGHTLKLYIEDARKRKWVTGGREKLQGVGSVKRDCAIWETFCQHHGIDYELVAPKNNKTKLNDKDFRRLTGWTERTNEHGRDAAMLVFGR